MPGKELTPRSTAGHQDRDSNGRDSNGRDSNDSPPLPGSRILAIVLAGCLLSVGMHWSLVTNIDSVTTDSIDRYQLSWQLAWIGHALKEQPQHILESNTHWPVPHSLAFTDAMYGYAPAALAGSGPKAAMVRFNLVFLFTYALAFVGAALLARELGLSWAASTVAGAAFAFAPWRLEHLNHLHVLSSGGIPLSLFLMMRGFRRASAKMVLAGWAVAAWQLSLGFTLGLQLAYLLGALGVLWLLRSIVRRSLPVITKGLAAATGGGIVLFVAVGLAQGLPYLNVTRDHPESRRPPEAAAVFSPPPSGFLAAPESSVLWGEATKGMRDRLRWPPEMTLFPGLTLIMLAAIGLALPVLSGRWRLGLGLGIVATALLCLGYELAGGRFTYALLYDFAPGWQSSRTPGRLFTLTSLGLALAGGAGAEGMRRLIDRRLPGEALSTGLLAVTILAVFVLAEGKAKISLTDLPPPPPAFSEADPQLHLPSDGTNDPLYVFWSTSGFPRMFNGYGGFVPSAHERLRDRIRSFPDSETVDLLRSMGFRTVIAHLGRVGGTPWESIAGRSIEGLALKREVRREVIVFKLDGGG